MTRSPLLLFESDDFAVVPGEDEVTNPGVYGKALAGWVGGQLRGTGVDAGDVIAEDFGWCEPVKSASCSLYVACSSGDSKGQWRVFVFAEGGLLHRMFGKDRRAEMVAELYARVHQCLQLSSRIRNLREEAAGG